MHNEVGTCTEIIPDHLPADLVEAFENPDPDPVRVEEARERIDLVFERGMKESRGEKLASIGNYFHFKAIKTKNMIISCRVLTGTKANKTERFIRFVHHLLCSTPSQLTHSTPAHTVQFPYVLNVQPLYAMHSCSYTIIFRFSLMQGRLLVF